MRITNFEKIYGEKIMIGDNLFEIFENPHYNDNDEIKFSIARIDMKGNSLPGTWYTCYLTSSLPFTTIEWWNNKGSLIFSQRVDSNDIQTIYRFISSLTDGLTHLTQIGKI